VSPAAPERRLDVLVVGGGISGLACALALAQAGRRVHVVEQAPRFAEIGAGLQLGANATRAFQALGVLDPILRTAVLPPRAVIRDAVTGEDLTVLDLGPPFRRRYGHPYLVAHRHDVLSALLDACRAVPGITLETERTVVSAAEGSGGAVVTFADGDRYRADLLVGADGIRSRVRTIIDETPPRFSGHVAYRGTVPREDVVTDLDGDDVVLWIGPGIHLMQYPVRRGTLYNQVAVYERPAGVTQPYGVRAEFEQAFAVAHPRVQACVALLDGAHDWPVYDRDPLPHWTTPHVALVGDAAHAMLQYLGQGACQALEDALSLARAVGAHPEDQRRALKEFEEQRVPLATRCQEVARPWGDLWHTRDALLLALRNRVFRLRRPDDYSDLDWLYAERRTNEDVA
jgi:2-polyprenyl-6-methoxyphenol hydroxylase-like FAD-dependent oxidoreductase